MGPAPRYRRNRKLTAARGIALAGLLLLAACDSPAGEEAPVLPSVGTVMAIAGPDGDVRAAEVLAVNGRYVTVGQPGDDALKSTTTYYRGLFPVAGTEGAQSFSVQADEAALEKLFPMSVGNQVQFAATYRSTSQKAMRAAKVTIKVRQARDLALQDRKVKVYSIDTVMDVNIEGRNRRWVEQALYAPSLGLSLEESYVSGGGRVTYRVLTVDESGRAASPARTLGTTMI